jgi:hypothetical protein
MDQHNLEPSGTPSGTVPCLPPKPLMDLLPADLQVAPETIRQRLRSFAHSSVALGLTMNLL